VPSRVEKKKVVLSLLKPFCGQCKKGGGAKQKRTDPPISARRGQRGGEGHQPIQVVGQKKRNPATRSEKMKGGEKRGGEKRKPQGRGKQDANLEIGYRGTGLV